MKSIIKFLLKTGAGRLIVQTLAGLFFDEIRYKIRRFPRDKQNVINEVLNVIEPEVTEAIAKKEL